jgi:diamine N-acetyltransferase
MIRAITSDKELCLVTQLLRASFGTVAKEFNVTEQMWPSHPAFITGERVKELISEGLRFYGLFQNRSLIGVVGIRKQDERKYSIEKLAVLPDCRHNGLGKKIVAFACKKIREAGGKIASLAVIDEHTILKQWYSHQGFALVETKRFEGFPFTVGFMEKVLISAPTDQIRPIISNADLHATAEVIRAAFLTMAEEAGFTPENCPGFPAFITDTEVQDLAGEGLQFYGLFDGEILSGVVGLRKLEDGQYNLEKLAVLPEYRHRGFGRQLVDFVCEISRQGGGKKLSLATGLEAVVLVAWYLAQGFVQTGTLKNPNLPFTFCYLEKEL